jgi:tetratricopeptide (TPR) repeat protein
MATEDAAKVESLISLGDYFLYKNLDSTIIYYNKAQSSVDELESTIQAKYQPRLYHYTSIAYTSWGYVKEGMDYGQKALKSYEAQGMRVEASDIYMVVGTLHGQMGEVEKGTKLLLKSIAIKKELNATEKLGHAYMNLTLLYRDQGLLDMAIESIDSAINRFKEQNFEMGINRSYQIKGEVHKFAGNNKKALEVYQVALELYRKQTSNDIKGEVVLINSIAGLYLILKEYDRAISYYKDGLGLLKKTDNKELEGLTNHNIGGVYLEKKDLEKALDFYKKGLTFYEKIGHPTGRSRSYRGIGNVYQSVAKYDSAIVYYTKATNVLASKKNLDYGDVCKNLAKLHYQLYATTKIENFAFAEKNLKKAQFYGEESIACPAANLDASLSRYKVLKTIYQATNDHEQSLEMANKVIELSDSLFKKIKLMQF